VIWINDDRVFTDRNSVGDLCFYTCHIYPEPTLPARLEESASGRLDARATKVRGSRRVGRHASLGRWRFASRATAGNSRVWLVRDWHRPSTGRVRGLPGSQPAQVSEYA